jgi:NAD(P)-dependent dehydrogenase (short-subunit alcohol dehydrogenase family)
LLCVSKLVLFACDTVSGVAPRSTENSQTLAGRVALVTGAAKRLGRAVALRLAEQGADVVIHYRNSQVQAHEVVSQIESLGRRAVAIPADLGSISAIRRLFADTQNHFGRLDILINSAANFLQTDFAGTTEEIWDASLDTNLKAPFFCSQAAAGLLKKSGRGVIINFSDTAGILGWAEFLPHSVSKAGILLLTRGLAKTLAPDIRVNAIAPGTISMPGDPPSWEADFIRRAPLRRTGTPADVTDAVLFLIHSEFITGQILVVDGGRVL